MIVRTKNSARTLACVLARLRGQTVASEIIVVDSGSTDGTVALARRLADRVIAIPAERFSFGHALNVGASVARAPIHFALSSHAFPPDSRWLENSLAMYDRSDVAATNGAASRPGSHEPLAETFHQTLADARAHPLWGFSNTGSSWRAEVWAAIPFDEQLAASEDKEWAFRVLAAGWAIAFDPRLLIGDGHRRHRGIRALYGRTRREFTAIGSFAPAYAPLAPITVGELLREWLTDIPPHAPYGGWRRRLNYFRFTELVGKYRGLRHCAAASPPASYEPGAPTAIPILKRP